MSRAVFISLLTLCLAVTGGGAGWATEDRAAAGADPREETRELQRRAPASSQAEAPVSGVDSREKAKAGPAAEPEKDSTVQLDAVVVTATRTETPAFDTPLPVNVIERQQIERQMPVSLGEVFKREAGLDASTTGPNVVRPMIRGLFDDRVLVLVDGIRLSEQRGGGDHRLSIDPDQIQRIEVVRGPGSVFYGSDALGGVINIITRKAKIEERPGGRAQFSLGSGVNSANDGLEQTTAIQAGYNRVNLFFNSVYRNTGNINTPRGKLFHSFYRGYTLSGGGNITWPQSELTFSAWGTEANIGVPNRTAQESHFDDEVHVMAQGTYRRYDISGFCPEIKMDAAFQRHQRHMHILNPIPPNVDLEIFLNLNTWNFQPQALLTWGDRQRFTTGLQFFREDADSTRDRWGITPGGWVSLPLPGVIPEAHRTGLGLYLQDEIRLTERFSLTPGVRFDWIRSAAGESPLHPVKGTSKVDTAFSGSFGCLYRLTPHLHLIANMGRAFRAPTLLERYFFGPHQDTVDIGNPDLRPETSFNLDLGLKAKYANFQGAVSLFRNEISDYIVKRRTGQFDPVSGLEIDKWENVGRALLYGMEAQGEYDLGAGFALFASCSYVRGKDETGSTDLPDIPPFRGNYGWRYRRKVQPDWELWTEFAGLTAARQGKIASYERPTGGYTIFTWSAGATFRKNLRLTLMVANLADKSYHDHLSRVTWINEQPGRNVRFQMNYTF
jgi:TonB-dependent heme/hemoglobin receptor